jgi:hypothetical protein
MSLEHVSAKELAADIASDPRGAITWDPLEIPWREKFHAEFDQAIALGFTVDSMISRLINSAARMAARIDHLEAPDER